MKDTTIFSLLLELPPRWQLTEVVPDPRSETVLFRAERLSGAQRCPRCGAALQSTEAREVRLPVLGRILSYNATLAFLVSKWVCRVHGLIDDEGFEGAFSHDEEEWCRRVSRVD